MLPTAPQFRPESIRRKEDLRLVTGQGRYVGDLEFDGMVEARFVRSQVAHGLVLSIDTSAADEMPGTVATITGRDLGVAPIPSSQTALRITGMDRPVLALDRVRFVGEALAVVVAENAEAAADAAAEVWVDIDPLPAVVTAAEAATGAPIHPAAADNFVERFTLGDETPVWDFPIVTTTAVHNQRVAPTPIEPMAAIAVPTVDGVRLVVAHQAPHRLKQWLAGLLDFPVEVSVPDVGGGFGQKARFYPDYVALAAVARRLGRPIRWLQTRRENFLAGSHGRDMSSVIRLGGDTDGRIERAHIEITANVGAYPHIGAQAVGFARLVSQELYDIAELTLSSRTLVTNTAPMAPYRGAGRPQAAYAMERAIDDFARRVGLPPEEVRRRNLIPKAAFPFRTHTGALYDSGDYEAALDKAIELLDLAAVRRRQAARLAAGRDPIGVGFGGFVERAGGAPDTAEYARVELRNNARFVVHTGSTSNGQGHETVWAQLVAQVFDVHVDAVEVVSGDTAAIPRGSGSTASRSAQIGGAAVWRCATALARQCAAIAASIRGSDPESMAPHKSGFADAAGNTVPLEEISERAATTGETLLAEEWYSPGAQTFPYGVHGAVVEVVIETGEVRILHYVAVDDTGTVLNPMIVEGQTQGSIVQGIGQAMTEAVEYDPNGQLLTGTFLDYRIPAAGDVPPVTTGRVVTPAPSNPLGAKGAAEGGTIGAPPAVVNAVLDALAPYGVDAIDMPLRPDRVWHAIREARESVHRRAATPSDAALLRGSSPAADLASLRTAPSNEHHHHRTAARPRTDDC